MHRSELRVIGWDNMSHSRLLSLAQSYEHVPGSTWMESRPGGTDFFLEKALGVWKRVGGDRLGNAKSAFSEPQVHSQDPSE